MAEKQKAALAGRPLRSLFRVPEKRGPGGAKGSRTPDLLHAMQALSQLSYGPGPGSGCTKRALIRFQAPFSPIVVFIIICDFEVVISVLVIVDFEVFLIIVGDDDVVFVVFIDAVLGEA